MSTPSPRPRSLPRRFERWIVGVAMGIAAFVMEKLVMRSIRKGGGTVPSPEADGTPITTRGVDIQG